MVEQMISHVLNLILGGVVSYIFALYRQKKKENDALKAGL